MQFMFAIGFEGLVHYGYSYADQQLCTYEYRTFPIAALRLWSSVIVD